MTSGYAGHFCRDRYTDYLNFENDASHGDRARGVRWNNHNDGIRPVHSVLQQHVRDDVQRRQVSWVWFRWINAP